MVFQWGRGLMVAAGLAVSLAHAQPYPTRPLRMIVPYPPGASVDFTARLMGQRLGDALGQPVVIDNRSGAGGVIAAELAARAAPDGYTLFFGTPASLCVSPAIQTKVAPAIVTRINAILNTALKAEDVRQILISQGSDPRPTSIEDFAKFVRSDCPNWARAVKLAGIKPE